MKVYIAFNPQGFVKGVFAEKIDAGAVSETVEEWEVVE